MPSFQLNAFRKWGCFPSLNMNVWRKPKYFWSSSFLSMKIFIFNSISFLSCLQKTPFSEGPAEFSCSSLRSDCHCLNKKSNSNLSGLTSNPSLILVALCKGLCWFLYTEICFVTGLGHLLLKKGQHSCLWKIITERAFQRNKNGCWQLQPILDFQINDCCSERTDLFFIRDYVASTLNQPWILV